MSYSKYIGRQPAGRTIRTAMKKLKVYEVARSLFGSTLGMGDLIRAAEKVGAKSHSSSITLEQARTLRGQFRCQMAPRRARRQFYRDHGSRFTWKEFSLA
jgi:hypothetical protein